MSVPAEVSERLKFVVFQEFSMRGKFRRLEEATQISWMAWKNFYYGNQKATEEMVKRWCELHSEDASFVLSGKKKPMVSDYPFGAQPPTEREVDSCAARLKWVIRESCSPRAPNLFGYLESKTYGKVTAQDWAKFLIGEDAPTLEMLELVVELRPYFLEWVVSGWTSPQGQVDPTCNESIRAWEARCEERLSSMAATLNDA